MELLKDNAEKMYAGAIAAAEKGDVQDAITFGRGAIMLYEAASIQTLEDAVAINQQIGGIPIPELMHEDVVRARLKQYGIRI